MFSNWRLLVIVVLIAGALFTGPVTAVSITVDGDLADWGLNLAQPWNLESTWEVPSNTISYMVEDNHNPNHGLANIGVHIRGSDSNSVFYDERKVQLRSAPFEFVSEPYGTEIFDLEAIYYTQDSTNLYLAIITSMPPEGIPPFGTDQLPGDLALNLDNDLTTGHLGYEMGVRLGTHAYHGFLKGAIVKDPTWVDKGYLLPEGRLAPNLISAGVTVGTAEVFYGGAGLPMDNSKPNYLIEVAIPKAALGINGYIPYSSTFVGDGCVNDHIIFVPEFPSLMISCAVILGLIGAMIWTKSRKFH